MYKGILRPEKYRLNEIKCRLGQTLSPPIQQACTAGNCYDVACAGSPREFQPLLAGTTGQNVKDGWANSMPT